MNNRAHSAAHPPPCAGAVSPRAENAGRVRPNYGPAAWKADTQACEAGREAESDSERKPVGAGDRSTGHGFRGRNTQRVEGTPLDTAPLGTSEELREKRRIAGVASGPGHPTEATVRRLWRPTPSNGAARRRSILSTRSCASLRVHPGHVGWEVGTLNGPEKQRQRATHSPRVHRAKPWLAYCARFDHQGGAVAYDIPTGHWASVVKAPPGHKSGQVHPNAPVALRPIAARASGSPAVSHRRASAARTSSCWPWASAPGVSSSASR